MWLSNGTFSQKHDCESGKHDMMPLATVKLENKFMDNEDMFKSLFLLQLHKHICFELSFLTFIPALYTKTLM